MERSTPRGAQIKAGLLAGIVGGISVEVFYFLAMLPGGQAAQKLLGSFAFEASVLLGPSAYSSPAAVPLGFVLHFCVAIAWALGYVYLARSQRHLLTHPWLSGAAFGLIVYGFVQVSLLAAAAYRGPSSAAELAIQLLLPTVFYGVPVGLVVARLLRADSAAREQTV